MFDAKKLFKSAYGRARQLAEEARLHGGSDQYEHARYRLRALIDTSVDPLEVRQRLRNSGLRYVQWHIKQRGSLVRW